MSRFVDEVEITVVSGKGGAGAVSFRREKYVPRGGPDGGDGGDGGYIIIKVKNELRTLYDLKSKNRIKAKNGSPGSGRNKKGKNGKDVFVSVPPGTVVIDTHSKRVLADLTDNDSFFITARGGKGGLGNAQFATSTNQAPRYAQQGGPGSELTLTLQLKVIADIGIIGLPNAGKSTLLSVLTNARPKIGEYPFTTLAPNLGVMKYKDEKEFILADVPGLIEGASRGHGLGIRFLKHIERTKALLFLIDLAEKAMKNHYEILIEELKRYSETLLGKPRLIVGSKMDIAEEKQAENLLASYIEGKKFTISSATGYGIESLKDAIALLMESINAGTKH